MKGQMSSGSGRGWIKFPVEEPFRVKLTRKGVGFVFVLIDQRETMLGKGQSIVIVSNTEK